MLFLLHLRIFRHLVRHHPRNNFHPANITVSNNNRAGKLTCGRGQIRFKQVQLHDCFCRQTCQWQQAFDRSELCRVCPLYWHNDWYGISASSDKVPYVHEKRLREVLWNEWKLKTSDIERQRQWVFPLSRREWSIRKCPRLDSPRHRWALQPSLLRCNFPPLYPKTVEPRKRGSKRNLPRPLWRK